MVVSCIGPLLSFQMHNLYLVHENNHNAIQSHGLNPKSLVNLDWLGSHFKEYLNYNPQLPHSYGSHWIGRLQKEKKKKF